MPIQRTNQSTVRGPIPTIIVVDGEAISWLEPIEFLQRRPAPAVALHVKHREVDLTISAIDSEIVVPGRERNAVVVHSIPKHGMASCQGRAGKYPVADVGWIEIDAIQADHDFVGKGVLRVEGEHTAR